MEIKGAIFDMDGTLIDSLGGWDILWQGFSEKYGLNNFKPSKADDKAVRTLLLDDAMDFIHETYKIGNSGKELLNEANLTFERLYREQVGLKDGVEEFLQYLTENNVKMCIASATDTKLLGLAIKHCGLDKYFDKVISCSDVGKGKDEPDVFVEALNYLGTELSKTCVFEDSLVAIKTASGYGFKTVGIFDKYNYGHDEMEKISDYYISENHNLKELIGKI